MCLLVYDVEVSLTINSHIRSFVQLSGTGLGGGKGAYRVAIRVQFINIAIIENVEAPLIIDRQQQRSLCIALWDDEGVVPFGVKCWRSGFKCPNPFG